MDESSFPSLVLEDARIPPKYSAQTSSSEKVPFQSTSRVTRRFGIFPSSMFSIFRVAAARSLFLPAAYIRLRSSPNSDRTGPNNFLIAHSPGMEISKCPLSKSLMTTSVYINCHRRPLTGMCPEVCGKRTAPSTPSSGYQIRRQPPRVREPRSDVASKRCPVKTKAVAGDPRRQHAVR